jgi:hypothetical protein
VRETSERSDDLSTWNRRREEELKFGGSLRVVSWVKDLGEYIADDTHIVLTRAQYESLDGYESIGEPTAPSVGRAYRTHNRGHRKPVPVGLVVFVEPDPEPGYVLRVGRVPLFLEE